MKTITTPFQMLELRKSFCQSQRLETGLTPYSLDSFN
jgi:hypothetical protein